MFRGQFVAIFRLWQLRAMVIRGEEQLVDMDDFHLSAPSVPFPDQAAVGMPR